MRLQKSWFLLLVLIVVAGVSFLTYFARIAKTVYGGGDSGDLITASYFLGVPHPPGYPLYTLIGAVFARLPIAASIAARVNLTSAIFEAVTVSVVFLVVYFLTRKFLIAIVAAGTLAFSYGFWFYAEFAEVFPLNNLFVSLIVLFLVLWHQTEKKVFLYSLFFVIGLSLTNHHSIILFLPGIFIYFLLSGKIKQVAKPVTVFLCFILFLLPLSLYLFPFFSAKFIHPPIAWDDPVNIKNLVRLVTRADYGSFQSSSTAFIEEPGGRLKQIFLYFRFFSTDFTVLGLALLIFGLILTFIKDRKLFYFLFVSFALAGPLFLSYANFPTSSPFEYGVIERFTLASFILAVVIFALGLFYGIEIITSVLRRKNFFRPSLTKILILVIEIIFLTLPATLYFTNLQRIDLSKNFSAETFVRDVLSSVPQNSLLLTRGDIVVLNSLYLHLVEKVRPDLKIVFSGIMPLDWYYYKNLPKLYPELQIPRAELAKRISNFLSANTEKFEIYQYGTPPQVADFVEVPQGLVWKFSPKDKQPSAEQVKATNNQIWPQLSDFANRRQGYRDLISEYTQNLYSEKRYDAGSYFARMGDYQEAKRYYQDAILIGPANYPAKVSLARVEAKLGHCPQALSVLNSLRGENPLDVYVLKELSDLYKNCFGDLGKSQEFADFARKANAKILKLPSLEEF